MEVEDLRQILALVAAYGRTIDAARWDEHAALYADDCHLVVFGADYAGRNGILEFLKAARKGKHITAVPDIEIDGDRARVSSDYVFFLPSGSLFNAGRYDDELVREAGTWRIRTRTISVDFRAEG